MSGTSSHVRGFNSYVIIFARRVSTTNLPPCSSSKFPGPPRLSRTRDNIRLGASTHLHLPLQTRMFTTHCFPLLFCDDDSSLRLSIPFLSATNCDWRGRNQSSIFRVVNSSIKERLPFSFSLSMDNGDAAGTMCTCTHVRTSNVGTLVRNAHVCGTTCRRGNRLSSLPAPSYHLRP